MTKSTAIAYPEGASPVLTGVTAIKPAIACPTLANVDTHSMRYHFTGDGWHHATDAPGGTFLRRRLTFVLWLMGHNLTRGYHFDHAILAGGHHHYVPREGDPKRGFPADFYAATDCRGNYYWGERLNTLTESQLFAVMLHEVMHEVRGDHAWLKKDPVTGRLPADLTGVSIAPQLMNVALDYTINTALAAEAPPYRYDLYPEHEDTPNTATAFAANVFVWRMLPPKAQHLSELQIYARLQSKRPNNQQSQQLGDALPGETPSGHKDESPYGDSPDEATEQADRRGRIQRALDEHVAANPTDATGQSEQGQAPRNLKDLTTQSEQAARGIGGASADRILDIADRYGYATPNWVQRITRLTTARLIGGDTGHDFTYARYNRRSKYAGYIVPSFDRTLREELVLAIDTSGSIDTRKLHTLVHMANDLRGTFPNAKFTLIWCHSSVWRVDHLGSTEKITVPKTIKSGGTAFEPSFETVAELRRKGTISKPSAFIYLTDLEGSFPDEAPDYPVYWVAYGEFRWGSAPSWVKPRDVIVANAQV